MHISAIILLVGAPFLSLASPIDFDLNIEERAVEADNATATPDCCPPPVIIKYYCGTQTCNQVNTK